MTTYDDYDEPTTTTTYDDLQRRLRTGNKWAYRKGRDKRVGGNIKGVHWTMIALSLLKTREVRGIANIHHHREIMNSFAGMVQGRCI